MSDTKTWTRRRAEMEQVSFIDLRNVAYMTYKKPDPSGRTNPDGTPVLVPLMEYEDTLRNRENVFQTLLSYELQNGMITDDRSNPSTQQNPAQVPATNGVQMSNGQMPPLPQPPAPQFGQQPAPGFAPPGFQPQPGFPPPAQPPQYQHPPALNGQPATPQQAAAAPQMPPPQQAAPPPGATAPTTRRKRSPSTATAPPTAAPTAPQAQLQQQVPVAVFNPGFQQGPPPQAQSPVQQFQQMAPPPGFQAQQFPAGAPMPQQVAPAQIDLGPVTKRVDGLGQTVNSIGVVVENLKNQVAELMKINTQLLVAMNHLYLSTPGAAAAAQGKNIATLPAFREYLESYVPR